MHNKSEMATLHRGLVAQPIRWFAPAYWIGAAAMRVATPFL